MKESEAQDIIDVIQSMNLAFRQIDDVISGMDDTIWKKKLSGGLGDVFGSILMGLVEPLVKEFPQVDPDKLPNLT